MKITQTNDRYIVELENGRLHILNRKALIWNLKHVFNIKGEQGKDVMKSLDATGQVEINLNKVA